MGHHRSADRAANEAHGGGAFAGLVGVEFDIVVLGDPAAVGLEPADALPDFVDPFLGAGSRESFGELGQCVLEAPGESLGDAAFFRGALLGEAVQAHLLGVFGEHLVQMHAVIRRSLDTQCRLGVEVAVAFAAHHQVAVAVLTQPPQPVFGGDSAVHHHQGGARGVERVEHLGKREVLAHVAGEDLGATHESAGVEHQPQGEQRAIGTLVLGVSTQRLGLAPRLALEVGIAQVVERDGGVQVEQPHGPVEQMVLDGVAVCHQRIGGAIQPHRSHGCELHPQQLAERAAFTQPAPGGALRARPSHARDDRADGGGAHRRAETDLLEQRAQSELVHRPQSHVLDADRAWTNQLQGVDIDVLDVTPSPCRRGGGPDAFMGEQLGGDALGVRFKRRGAIRWQWELTGEEFVDAPAQDGPIALGDLEVPSQIEQGALSHLRAEALGAHEAEGEVVLAAAAGTGASDKHGRTIAGVAVWCNTMNIFYGTTSGITTKYQWVTCENRPNRAKFPPNRGTWW